MNQATQKCATKGCSEPAVNDCSRCGRSFCPSCLEIFDHKPICRPCARGVVPAKGIDPEVRRRMIVTALGLGGGGAGLLCLRLLKVAVKLMLLHPQH
ncbi:MAG: hypothetical protein ACLQVD_09115 [Capsulimonadaceae bacterium]